MKKSEVLNAWASILNGRKPSLSIEITRECPLRCPGCYAYEPEHLGAAGQPAPTSDYKGDDLVRRLLAIVDREQPIHLSVVGGDPWCATANWRCFCPSSSSRGIHVQLVTSAFRPLPKAWTRFPSSAWSSPSTASSRSMMSAASLPPTNAFLSRLVTAVTIHCTVTGQIAGRPGYLEEFLRFWSARPEVKRIWVSLFTPQNGAEGPEILHPSHAPCGAGRAGASFPSVSQVPDEPANDRGTSSSAAIAGGVHLRPHHSVAFRRLGNPHRALPIRRQARLHTVRLCCLHGVGGVGHHRVLPGLTAGHLMFASERIGTGVGMFRLPLPQQATLLAPPPPPLTLITGREIAEGIDANS